MQWEAQEDLIRIFAPGYIHGEFPPDKIDSGLIKAISDALKAGTFLWVDFDEPTEEEADLLKSVFQFHPLAIEDCLHRFQRPKVDEYPEYLFLILHAVGPSGQGRRHKIAEFDVFLGGNYLVTFHLDKLKFVEEAYKDYDSSSNLAQRGIGFLLYRLLRGLIDEYFPVLDKVESRLEAIERRVFVAPNQRLLSEAFELRHNILSIRKSLSPQREILNLILRKDKPFINEANRIYFMDAYDHILRLFDLVDNYHDLLSSVLDAYLSSTSNRMNEIMKVLTIITTIMMPLSVIAGIYGMNFKYMPELNVPWAYPVVLGVMALITAGMLWYFRWKKWI